MAVDNSWREPERSIWPFYDCLLVLRDIEESGQVTRSKWLHALDEVRLYVLDRDIGYLRQGHDGTFLIWCSKRDGDVEATPEDPVWPSLGQYNREK